MLFDYKILIGYTENVVDVASFLLSGRGMLISV